MRSIYVVKYPSGRYGFVGLVPSDIAFTGNYNESDLNNARQCGLGIARRIAEREGRTIETSSFTSEREAIDFTTSKGHSVARLAEMES